MLQGSYSRTIDPQFLDLQAYPIAHQQAVDTLSEPDEVAITSGQAVYDERIDYQMNTWSNSNDDGFYIDDFEPLADLDFGSTQVHSAPARAWDMGGLDSDSSSRYEVSSPVRENEPWNHLQTSAFSAPGPDHRSSRVYQSEALSPEPSSLLDPYDSRGALVGTRHYQQDARMNQRMLYDYRHHKATGNNSLLGQSPQDRYQRIRTPQSERCSQGYNAEEGIESKESAISSFPSSSRHDNRMAGSLTSSTTAPRAIPCGRKAGGRATGGSRQGVDSLMSSLDYSMFPERTGNSFPKLQPVDMGLLPSAIDSSWQQHQSLTSEPEWIYGISAASCGASSRGCLNDDPDWPSCSPHKSVPRSKIHQEILDCTPCDYPGAMRILGSSEHYQADQTSSFPPTAGHLPDYLPTLQTPRPQRSTTISTSRPSITLPNNLSLPMRRKASKTKTHRRSRSGSLKAIQEDGLGILGSSPTGSIRGRRKGQLPFATALAAAQKRLERTVCIRCRMMKQTCGAGDLPCEGCQKNFNARSWGQPCTKADFRNTVDVGTCNAVFQRSASVMPPGQSERINIPFDGTFNVSQILRSLQSHRGRYNFHVQQYSGFSYVLDLAKLTRVLSIVHRGRKMDTFELDDFGESKASKASDWLDCLNCLDHIDPSASIVGQSIKLNNMPSRNSYSFLPLDSAGPPRVLNVTNENDKKDILLAVHLCRIVLRALEVSAFRSLQKEINELSKNKQSTTDIELLVQHLREILFSLRWRISWWAVFGMSSSIPDQDCYTERVTGLTQTLYYWYFVARKKLLSFRSPSLSGQWSVYADATYPVFDDFPHDESVEGFGAWLAHGQVLVRSAKVKLPQTRPMPCY